MSIGNRILCADDCLDVLTDESALPSESVDLIYLDPPFNSKSGYNLPFKGKYENAKPVEAGLRNLLASMTRPRPSGKLKPLPSWKVGTDLVDVANRDALYAAMEKK